MAAWERDSDVSNCRQCFDAFTPINRRHHCRNCGKIFCNSCSKHTAKVPTSGKEERVCVRCFTTLKMKARPSMPPLQPTPAPAPNTPAYSSYPTSPPHSPYGVAYPASPLSPLHSPNYSLQPSPAQQGVSPYGYPQYPSQPLPPPPASPSSSVAPPVPSRSNRAPSPLPTAEPTSAPPSNAAPNSAVPAPDLSCQPMPAPTVPSRSHRPAPPPPTAVSFAPSPSTAPLHPTSFIPSLRPPSLPPRDASLSKAFLAKLQRKDEAFLEKEAAEEAQQRKLEEEIEKHRAERAALEAAQAEALSRSTSMANLEREKAKAAEEEKERIRKERVLKCRKQADDKLATLEALLKKREDEKIAWEEQRRKHEEEVAALIARHESEKAALEQMVLQLKQLPPEWVTLLQSVGLTMSDLSSPDVAKMIFKAVNTVQTLQETEVATRSGNSSETTNGAARADVSAADVSEVSSSMTSAEDALANATTPTIKAALTNGETDAIHEDDMPAVRPPASAPLPPAPPKSPLPPPPPSASAARVLTSSKPSTGSTRSAPVAKHATSGNLLEDIRKGKSKLNALPPLTSMSKKTQDGLVSLLADAMAKRRNVIKEDVKEAEEESDW